MCVCERRHKYLTLFLNFPGQHSSQVQLRSGQHATIKHLNVCEEPGTPVAVKLIRIPLVIGQDHTHAAPHLCLHDDITIVILYFSVSFCYFLLLFPVMLVLSELLLVFPSSVHLAFPLLPLFFSTVIGCSTLICFTCVSLTCPSPCFQACSFPSVTDGLLCYLVRHHGALRPLDFMFGLWF